MATHTKDNPEKKRKPEWHEVHRLCFQKLGYERPAESVVEDWIADWTHESRHMFLSLPERCREVVYFKALQHGSIVDGVGPHVSREVVVDVSQSIDRAPTCDAGVATCLTGSSLLWLLRSKRLMLGVEVFCMQGGSANNYPKLTSAKNSLLLDMAGNMFNGPVFTTVVFAAISSI